MAKAEAKKVSSMVASGSVNATHMCDHKKLYFGTLDGKPQIIPIGTLLAPTEKQIKLLGKRIKPLVEVTDDPVDTESIVDQAKTEAAEIIAAAQLEADKIKADAEAEAATEKKGKGKNS